MLRLMRVLVVLSFLIFSNSPSALALEANCFKSADIVCHLQLFLYCIDTVNKKVTHGANFAHTYQQPLHAPDNDFLGPDFRGSLQTKLEITGAGTGPNRITIPYFITLSLDKKKIIGTVKTDGDKSGDLDCHFNN